MRVRSVALVFSIAGLMVAAGGIAGCDSDRAGSTNQSAVEMFAPTGMRIHPIFTQIEDWNKDGKFDGIEAQLEFQDQFNDPTKASGRVLFELFDYRKDSPDPRGRRVAGPWIGSLATLDEQEQRWNTTLRTYRFQLTYPEIRADKSYVLTAIFELTGGGRFFDRVILPARRIESGSPDQTGGLGGFFPPVHDETPTSRDSQP